MRELPVMPTVEHAIKSAIRNFPFAVHVSWPWMAILAPLVIASNLYLRNSGLELEPKPGEPPDFAMLAKVYSIVLPVGIVRMIAFASIAVSWHRYILLDEVPEGWERLRLDALAWRYFFNFLGITLLLVAIGFVLSLGFILVGEILATLLGKASLALLVPAGAFGAGWLIVLGYRLSIKLPAIALGRTDYRLPDALRDSRDNGWRIFAVLILLVLCSLAVLVASLAVAFPVEKFGAIGFSFSIAVQLLAQWISTIVGITMLTSLYGYFVERRDFPK